MRLCLHRSPGHRAPSLGWATMYGQKLGLYVRAYGWALKLAWKRMPPRRSEAAQ